MKAINSKAEIRQIVQRQNTPVTVEEFVQMYDDATRVPTDFLLVDTTSFATTNPRFMFRKSFSECYLPQSIADDLKRTEAEHSVSHKKHKL